ncbi:MAG TPA: outer membrane beta-barrel protein [Thermoanaerobaculia bacterium]|nr:outer membrane beta-barrel protein [Thermoanaerobaculia bacterium]
MSLRNTHRSALVVLAGLALLGASPAWSQDQPSIEITPFLGYDFGGNFDVFDFEFGRVRFELEDGVSYGVIADFPISRSFQVEAIIFRQPTTLSIDEGLFGPRFELSDIEIDHLQAGLLWQGWRGQLKPFFSAGIGLARMNPDLPELDSETRFAFNFGGGIKTFFTPHFGLRLEGRLLVITLPEDDEDLFCCRGDDNGITQGHVAVGFIFAF